MKIRQIRGFRVGTDHLFIIMIDTFDNLNQFQTNLSNYLTSANYFQKLFF